MTDFRQPSFSKALKLGSKTKDVDSFVDKLRSEGTDVTASSLQPRASRGTAPPPTSAVRTERSVFIIYTKDGLS
jgi:hypothetical protein